MEREPLNIPIIAFDGRRDTTIARGYMRQWRRYTSGRFRNVAIAGDHYFVSKLFREVLPAVCCLSHCSSAALCSIGSPTTVNGQCCGPVYRAHS